MIRNPRHSLIGREMFLNGIWEPEVTSFVCERIRPGMTALDVGADIGYYTLLFAKRVGRHGNVIGFEPIPSAKEKAEYNVRLNGYSNVIISDRALFSRNGSTILEEPFKLSRISPGKSAVETNDIQVQMVVFDQYAPELNIERIDLVKIDVEGAELDVLRGMRHSLRKYHPALLIEVHPNALGCFNHSPEDLVKFLAVMKYCAHPVDKSSLNFENGNITIYCT